MAETARREAARGREPPTEGAALGAEGGGKDATLLIGNGYAPGHAELVLGLVRRHAAHRARFEARHREPA